MWIPGKKSIKDLKLHPELERLLVAVDREVGHNLFVYCGHRGEAEQNEAFASGKSKLQFPFSKHNSDPSCAVDMVLRLRRDDNDMWGEGRAKKLGEKVKAIAEKIGVLIRWGGDFKSFKDYVHYELN